MSLMRASPLPWLSEILPLAAKWSNWIKPSQPWTALLASARPRCLRRETTPTSLSKRFLRLKKLRAISAISRPRYAKRRSISTTTYALAAAPAKPNAPAKQRTNSTRVYLCARPFTSHSPKLFPASRPSIPTPAGNSPRTNAVCAQKSAPPVQSATTTPIAPLPKHSAP